MTLLQMYELFETNQHDAFITAVKEYGITDFLRDIQVEVKDRVLTRAEASSMEKLINAR